VSKPKYASAETVLSGDGAKQIGGRWNDRGLALVYASENSSLAILETLANVAVEELSKPLSILKILIPDDLEIETLNVRRLPRNWQEAGNPVCATIGSTWIRAATHLALRAPSAVNPLESTILLNPAHPGIRRCRIRRPTEVLLDQRLLWLVKA
jgi:RES domain-containing protein